MHKEYFIYMLQCNDNSYYTGITNNYNVRIDQHQLGNDPKSYVHKRKPFQLVYLSRFQDVTEAIAWEKKIKKWSRKKKEALIAGKYENLIHLSKNQYAKRIDSLIGNTKIYLAEICHDSKRLPKSKLGKLHPSTSSG